MQIYGGKLHHITGRSKRRTPFKASSSATINQHRPTMSMSPTQSPSTSNHPSVSFIPSLVPTKGPLPNPNNTEDFTTWQTIGQIWWVILVPIVAGIFYIGIIEYYKKLERADPNSSYSRRQRRRELEEARREYNRSILENAERRRRDWDYLWDEEGGLMRRGIKKEYILNHLCTKVRKNFLRCYCFLFLKSESIVLFSDLMFGVN